MFTLPQGDAVIDCFEVTASEPFFSQGKPCSSSICHARLLQLSHLVFDPSVRSVNVFPVVSHCLMDTSTRGVAMVPKVALDVLSCEVMRVLQLTDSCIVPISHQVPRKVRTWPGVTSMPTRTADSRRMRVMYVFCFHVRIFVCASLSYSFQANRSSMKIFTRRRWARLQPCQLRSGGREATSR